MLWLHDDVRDNGANILATADRVYLCNAQPSTYAQATSDYALGYGTVTLSAPQSHAAGRKILSGQITGTADVEGIPAYWAAVDLGLSKLLAVGELTGGTLMEPGQSWTLDALSLIMPVGLPAGAASLTATAIVTGAVVFGSAVLNGQVIGTLIPSSSWDGTTSWVGRSAPTESGTVHGSGFAQKAIGGFDWPPYMWVEDANGYITVGAAIGDRAWIDHVDFWLEGSTATASQQSENPVTGSFGWTIRVASRSGQDGDAVLYAKIVPVNGYERVILLPLTLNTNAGITRDERYVSPTGNNSNDGLTAGTAWATIEKALEGSGNGAPDGAIIYLTTGTHNWGGGNFNNLNTRTYDFRTYNGAVTVSATTRTTPSPRASLIQFTGVTFDMSKLVGVQARNVSPAAMILKDCDLTDPNGSDTVGLYTTVALGGVMQANMANGNGKTYLVECTGTAPLITGSHLYRNCIFQVGADALYQDDGSSGSRIFNLKVRLTSLFGARYTVDPTVTVNTTSYDGGTNRTTLTITTSNASTSGADRVKFTTGALSGQVFACPLGGGEYDSGTKTIILAGDVTAAAQGDSLIVYQSWHNDLLQQTGITDSADNLENVYIQRYFATAYEAQGILFQSGPPNGVIGPLTVSSSGTTVTQTGHGRKVNDILRRNASPWDYHRIESITDADHYETSAAFDPALSGSNNVIACKCVKDMAVVASVLACDQAGLYAYSQIQNGSVHVVFVQSTFDNKNLTIVVDTQDSQHPFGWEDFVMFDCIQNEWDNVPAAGYTFDNNTFLAGTLYPGTNGELNGNVTFDADYHPTGLTKTISGTPLFPWSYEGSPISAGALVGAQQVGS